jgi:hypothetical protein
MVYLAGGSNAPFFKPLPQERLFTSTATICPRDRRTAVTRVRLRPLKHFQAAAVSVSLERVRASA